MPLIRLQICTPGVQMFADSVQKLRLLLITFSIFYVCFVAYIMTYNKKNYLKNIRFILSVYKAIKERDIPDTYILRHEFPKYGIFISYRTWMNIKKSGLKPNSS